MVSLSVVHKTCFLLGACYKDRINDGVAVDENDIIIYKGKKQIMQLSLENKIIIK